MREVEITKLDLPKKTSVKTIDFVAEESPLHLFIGNVFWASILCTPQNLKEMAVGHLLSEGVIKTVKEIEKVTLEETDGKCTVELKPEVNINDRVRLSRLHQRVITSACGEGAPYQFSGKIPITKSNLRVNAQVLFDCVNQLNFKAEIFRKTGGVHVAAIYKADGSILALAEDVGRHNAVDKAIGMAALMNVDFGDCFLALSGRMSGDVVFKAAKTGLPIIASIAAALSSGIKMAEQANTTLAGFVRGKRMNIYSHAERILS